MDGMVSLGLPIDIVLRNGMACALPHRCLPAQSRFPAMSSASNTTSCPYLGDHLLLWLRIRESEGLPLYTKKRLPTTVYLSFRHGPLEPHPLVRNDNHDSWLAYPHSIMYLGRPNVDFIRNCRTPALREVSWVRHDAYCAPYTAIERIKQDTQRS